MNKLAQLKEMDARNETLQLAGDEAGVIALQEEIDVISKSLTKEEEYEWLVYLGYYDGENANYSPQEVHGNGLL